MLRHLPIASIVPNPDQPRKTFEAKALRELASSIRENGLIQPITVRRLDDGTHMIVAGERRWRAHKLLEEQGHTTTILCNVRVGMDDDTMSIEAVIENLQRVDVKPLEEARAFQRLLDSGYTAASLAKKLGIGQSWRITYRTRLLNLEPEIQTLLDGGAITLNAASEIAKLSPLDQTRVTRRISSGQLRTDSEVGAAVQAILDKLSQADIFGDAGRPSEEEVATVNRMEAKIDAVAKMVAAGWKDGECVIIRKVDPGKAALLADQLAAIRKHLHTMEHDLRRVAAQAEILAA
jgi:ParB family chromosome partitioning protein